MDPKVIDLLNVHDYESAIELLLPNLEQIISQKGGRLTDEYYTVLNLYLSLAIASGVLHVKDLAVRELAFNLAPEEIEIRLFLNKCLLEICLIEGDYQAETFEEYAGFLLANLDEYFDIIEGTEDADEIMGQYKMLMFGYAGVQLDLMNLDKASEVLDLVCSIEDVEDEYPHEFYLEKKATVLAMQGKPEEAIEFLNNQLVEDNPDSIIILRKLAALELTKKNYSGAKDILERCLDILSAFEETETAFIIYGDLASLYYEMGETELALAAEAEIIAQDPEFVNMSSEAFATASINWEDMDTVTVTAFPRLNGISNGEYTYNLPNDAHLVATYTLIGTDEIVAETTFSYTPERIVHFKSPSLAHLEEGAWIRLKLDIFNNADKTTAISTFYQLIHKVPEEEDFDCCGSSACTDTNCAKTQTNSPNSTEPDLSCCDEDVCSTCTTPSHY